MNIRKLHNVLHGIGWIFLILGISMSLNAQETTQIKDKIKVISRVTDNKVLLRWAATTPSAWMKANRYGYHIERYTVKRNGVLLNPPEKKMLTTNALLPEPLEAWEQAIQQDDYAAILAQALYGEEFSVEQMQEGLAQIINKAREAEQRFSFALFAADMSFSASKKAALGFEDVSTVSGEEYLYRVVPQVTEKILKIEPGFISVTIAEPGPLPAPIDVYAVGDDKTILLTWEYELFKTVFTSYYVERSENGTDFKRLGDTPLVNLNDRPGTPAKRMFYADTLSQNDKKYYYRVKGISPFGELSPASEIVSATGIKKLEAVPHINSYQFDNNGDVTLKWEFKKEAEDKITGFELERSDSDGGSYNTIQSGLLPSSRLVKVTNPEASNYYRIAAIGKNNERNTSFPAFVQTVDSIPPMAPAGITGVIDSLGVVQLQWKANSEKDMLGYRVFRSNIEKEEWVQITTAPVRTTSFIDTVQVKSLNSKVYYSIVAVDERFNMSAYSEKLALSIPDVVPPSSPMFSKYKVEKEGIRLHWINSSSDDVAIHQLYRMDIREAEKGWLLIFQTDTVSSYLDNKVAGSIKYRYAIFAEDESGLQSAPSTPISISNQDKVNTTIVKRFDAVVDRINEKIEISWKKLPPTVSELLIYKPKKGELPVLWKQIPGIVNTLEDTSVSPNNVYIYQIKVITKTGEHSKLETKEVAY
ncbi:hypothetical protein U6A24_16625 [Aquimarina gracilis]|uniref:Fibronectin type-III domain-containing protein n=1 Tax=Aquimarina gracilis TaxID=874422 RepID=A0ABU5ZZ51_9FLAO|nr:hypothetical protein [Aquimarina gracilis]MEB3347100.1 hypothetical protein [Aquimarina gracilis]